jgi:tRNA U34 2-thiouridine synthase MnmA/TrmU
MTLDEQWELLKPQIIELMEDGWSRNFAFAKMSIKNNSKLYEICYMRDREFKELIKKYRKKQIGFVNNNLSQSA